MLCSFKSEKVLPINKNNELFVRRFKANRKCKAKARLIFLDQSFLTDWIGNKDQILLASNKRLVEHPLTLHSCDAPYQPFNSDRLSFPREYHEMKDRLNDHNGDIARNSCYITW